MYAAIRLPGAIAGYRLEESLGQGSMAAVYLASDERLHRPVALKVLAPDPDLDAAARARIIREARAAAAVDHAHILPVYEAAEADATVYVAMRYARGGDARSLLGRLGPLPPGYAWRITGQIASALDAAHAQGLVHRDVRPANILLDPGDTPAGPAPATREPGHAYLADFGTGRVFPRGQIIEADRAGGTLDYLAPEQVEGRTPDGRADLYALACTAFELLCGTPPFDPEQGLTLMYAQLYAPPPLASGQRPSLPVAVDSVLATALAKNPDDRYPNCTRFTRELGAALGLGPGETAALLRSRPAATDPAPIPEADRVQASAPRPAAGRQILVAGRRHFATVGERLTGDHPKRSAPPGPDRRGLGLLAPRVHALLAPHARVLRPVMAAAAVIVVIVAVVFSVALSKRPAHDRAAAPARSSAGSQEPGASPPPGVSSAAGASTAPSPVQASQLPAQAAQQAAALGTLLTSSAAARTALHRAVSQVSTCANLPGAARQLQNVVNQRSGEYDRVAALPTSALPGGPAVKSRLLTALSRSLTADRDYLRWAQYQRAGGCTPGSQSGAYQAAVSASQRADTAKQAFVRTWNPVAARYGIKLTSARDI